MKSSHVLMVACNVLGLAKAQWNEPPPTTADPDTISDCTWWFVATTSDTCASIASMYGLTEAELVSYVSSYSKQSELPT